MGLRRIVIVVCGLLALLTVGGAAQSVWLVSESQQTTHIIEHAGDNVREAQRLSLMLLQHDRVSDLYALGEAWRSVLSPEEQAAGLQGQLDLMKRQMAGDEEAARLMGVVDDAVQAYFVERDRLMHSSEIDQVRAGDRMLYPAFEAIADVESHQLSLATQTRREAYALMEAMENRAIAAAVLLIAGLFATAAVLIFTLYRPLIALRDSVSAVGDGPAVRMGPEQGPREIREIARALNERTKALAKERESRLTLLAAVAHELRNPLSALAMGVDRLRRTRAPSEGELNRGLDMIARQMSRLNRMIDDLLESARVEAGHLRLDRTPDDVRHVVRDVIELHRAQSSRHDLVARVPDESFIVDCDVLRIEQVFTNLISNAIKYSPKGGRIEVVLQRDRGWALITVSDEGIGIAPEDQRRVFEPYGRTTIARDAAPGVGLGLAVVKTIVEAHGGQIGVTSEPGRGSTFTVRLPLLGA